MDIPSTTLIEVRCLSPRLRVCPLRCKDSGVSTILYLGRPARVVDPEMWKLNTGEPYRRTHQRSDVLEFKGVQSIQVNLSSFNFKPRSFTV